MTGPTTEELAREISAAFVYRLRTCIGGLPLPAWIEINLPFLEAHIAERLELVRARP